MPRTRLTIAALALAALLSACGQPVATQPTTPPAPTAVSSTPPTEAPAAPTEAPVAPTEAPAAPTEAPAAAGVLPRPLYLLQSGNIFRLETDGSTQTQITYEVPFQQDVLAVTEFAVSPADSTLVYTVQRAGPPLLVRADGDGQNAAPLYDNPEAGVTAPLFTPDGQFVAARLFDTADDGVEFPAGLYLLPIAGGEPQLLVADDPIVNPETPAFSHQPLAFSPDGARLLTNRFSQQVEECDLAVVNIADGAVTALQVPPAAEGERQSTCGTGAWAADGSAIYFAPRVIGAPPASAAIWRADPASGESFPITPTPGVAPFTFYAAPGVGSDGELRAFVTEADAPPVGFADPPLELSYRMVRVDQADGTLTELRPAVNEYPEQVLWDADGRGAVAFLVPTFGDSGLFWLPANGDEAVLLLSATLNVSSYAWAAE